MPFIDGGAAAETGWLAHAVDQIREQVAGAEAVEDHLLIAGHEVRVRYADAALAAALSRANRHLRVASSGVPDLTIECGIDRDLALRLPAGWPAFGTSYFDDGSIVFTWDAPDGPLFVYDRERREGWAVFSSAAAVPTWEQASPLRRILRWWAADQGLQLVHAAAVGYASVGLLLVGRSGSGKSTTALACLEGGLGFAGDDYCLLSPGEPPRVSSLYLTAKADAHAVTLLAGLSDAFAQSELQTWGKSVLFADQVRPESVRTGFPLHGIVVPRLTGEATSRLTGLRPAAALRALAPSTLMQMPGDRASGLVGMAAIVRRVPAWELALGSPASAAALIQELLEGNAP